MSLKKRSLRSLIKNLLFLFVISGLFPLNPLHGAAVDSLTARQVAEHFCQARFMPGAPVKGLLAESGFELVLSHVERTDAARKSAGEATGSPQPLYYIFEIGGNRGFIIVSGDDRVTPVLGYSLTEGFSEGDQPPAFLDWMGHYADQIRFLIGQDPVPDPAITEKWELLLQDPVLKNAEASSAVTPLLTTTWDQTCYYNELCPADPYGPCGHAAAGCVAVAISQIMKYWNHPSAGHQIPGFYAGEDYGCLPDIASTSYDWPNMPDALNFLSGTTKIEAVAELMYHAGVAVQMDYGADGSGASSADARDALISYFNYSSSMEYVQKYGMDDESWKQLIRNELDNQRPVYYDGSGTIGHAFVCDGYQETDYFHFNWGWSGIYNGYYYLDDLTPGEESFNNFQSAIIGIEPEAESRPDPLEHILDIEGTGSGYTQTFTSGGSGAWDHRECDISTPGLEQVYRFVAPENGYYSLEVVSASNQLTYSVRKEECGEPGWDCAGKVSSSGTYGSFPWTAGSAYYILLDDVNLTANTHQFYISDPEPASPVIEYHRHTIDDDGSDASSGDDDGLAEAGETIELSVFLINTGEFDAHNVSAALSTADTHIDIISASGSFGDISAGMSAGSAEKYLFEISSESPEKEVTFTLDIFSDEENWSEEFTMMVYLDIPAAPEIQYYDHQIEDSPGSGDGDGIPEQGEHILMPLRLTNTGDLDATNVIAELSVSDADITITSASTSYGDIPEGSISQSESGFEFDISSECPEKDVTFILDITSDEGSWEDQFMVHISPYVAPAPELIYMSHQVDDATGTGDGDGLVEGGENIRMPVTLKNTGDEDAHNVTAVLSAADPDIQVTTPGNDFYTIPVNGSSQSSGNYIFEVSPDCGDKDVAFTLNITSEEGSWTDQFLVHILPGSTSGPVIQMIPEMNPYPNPVKDILRMRSGSAAASGSRIRILDSRGRLLYEREVERAREHEILEFDFSVYERGLYVLQLNNDGTSVTWKIIKE